MEEEPLWSGKGIKHPGSLLPTFYNTWKSQLSSFLLTSNLLHSVLYITLQVQLLRHIDLLIKASKKIILAGDFNTKHLTWISRNNNAVEQVLLNHYNKNDRIIAAPISATHIPEGTHSTTDVIDFAVLKNIISQHTIKILGFLSHSDHNVDSP